MKRLAVTVIVLAGLILAAAAVQGTPRMKLPETEFNFGFVPQNSKVTHVFWIHSIGDEPLEIKRVVPG